jgi:hypothetical protein
MIPANLSLPRHWRVHDPRLVSPGALTYDPALRFGLANAPTLFKKALPFRPPTPPRT